MSRRTLLIATRNPGKVREFAALLAALPFELRGLEGIPDAPHVAEDGVTYHDNAYAKALALARFSGLPTLADDSGLEVDALDGAPGVRSARFAGVDADDGDNVRFLLRCLAGRPPAERTARFRCVLVVARPDGETIAAEGSCEGMISEAPRGTSGFGYDPIFFYPPAGRTFAELSAAEKNRVSHRARACADLAPRLRAFLAGE